MLTSVLTSYIHEELVAIGIQQTYTFFNDISCRNVDLNYFYFKINAKYRITEVHFGQLSVSGDTIARAIFFLQSNRNVLTSLKYRSHSKK